MNKYVVIFCTPAASMQEWMTNTDEATRKTQTDKLMQDWNAWMSAHAANIIDKGLPLGKTKRVTKDGITDERNDLNFMMVVQAESHDAAAALLKDNPHLQTIPTSYAEVMDANMAM